MRFNMLILLPCVAASILVNGAMLSLDCRLKFNATKYLRSNIALLRLKSVISFRFHN